MKKTILAAAMAALTLSTAGADVKADVTRLLSGMVRAYREARPEEPFKPAIAVMPLEEMGDTSRRLGLGQALGAMIESTMQKSVDFVLVDRKDLGAVLSEIELALSGIGDSSGVDLGAIRNADYLLDGSVSEVGDGFLLAVRLVEVAGAEVVFAGDALIDRDELVRESEEYVERRYVSAYGLGIETAYGVFTMLTGSMAAAEGAVTSPFMLSSIVYRPIRWLVLSMGFESVGGQLWLAGTKEKTEYQLGTAANFDGTGTGTFWYEKSRQYLGMDAGAGFVWNFTPRFNVTVGGRFRFAPGITMTQKITNLPSPSDAATSISVFVEAQASDFYYAVPYLKLQYFLNPRLAVNLQYDYAIQLPKDKDLYYLYSVGGVYIQSTYPELYGLDPRVDPQGNPHTMDLSGHRVYLGVAVYL